MKLSCVVVLLLALTGTASAQQALVLSGGGSRGLAHTGVLFVLPERGYDPDLVVGTSMGAVIGALYAAGYEPEEIRKQVTEIGWRGMFEPTPLIVAHDRAVRYPMLSFDLSGGTYRVNRGLVGQWRINRALAALLFEANARSRGDFDKLARRYRPIVADLKTGEAIALERGDLALAARASMSVPGFFAPVEWEGRILVDGGIAANLPTGFARRLGAIEVIAVDVSRPLPDIHSLAPFAVVQRALDMMQANTQRDTIRPTALVVPQLPPGWSGANFPDDPSFLIEEGRKAALRDLPPATTPRKVQRAIPALPDSFTALVIEAPDSALAGLARAVFRGIAPGRYDAAAVFSAIDRIYASGLVEAVWPRVDESDALILRMVGQPRFALSAAGQFESDRGGRAWAVAERYGALASRPAVFSASAQLETLARAASLGARVHSSRAIGGAWSFGGYGSERSVRFFDEDEIRMQEVLRAGGWLGFELPHILRKRALVASVRGEWIDVESERDGWAWGPLIRWASVDPPGSVVGIPFTLEAERRWGDFNYTRVTLGGSFGMKVGKAQYALLGDARWASEAAPMDVQPALGDDHMIPGLQWGEQRGRTRAVAGLDAAYPFFSGFVRARVRTGAVAQESNLIDEARWNVGAQLGVVFPTPLGALEVFYGSAKRGGGRFDVSIGQRF